MHTLTTYLTVSLEFNKKDICEQRVRLTKRRVLKSGGVLATSVAIAGCSGSETSSESGEPEFEVREAQSSPSFVQTGEEITAAATVANVGDGSGTTSVNFSLDAAQSTVETETVDPGGTTQVTTDIQVPLIDSERHELTAAIGEEQTVSTPVDVYKELKQGLHGSVVSTAGESLVGSDIRIISTTPDFVVNVPTVDSSSRFFSQHLRNGDYPIQISFFGGNNEFTAVPDIVGLQDTYSVTSTTEILGQYEVPEGYRTEVQLVDEDGNPVSNLQGVSVRDLIGNSLRYDTNNEGYLISRKRSEPGIIVPKEGESNLVVDARPEESRRPVEFGEVYGSPDGEKFVLEVSNPDRFRTG